MVNAKNLLLVIISAYEEEIDLVKIFLLSNTQNPGKHSGKTALTLSLAGSSNYYFTATIGTKGEITHC